MLPGLNAAAVGLIVGAVFLLTFQIYKASPFPNTTICIGAHPWPPRACLENQVAFLGHRPNQNIIPSIPCISCSIVCLSALKLLPASFHAIPCFTPVNNAACVPLAYKHLPGLLQA